MRGDVVATCRDGYAHKYKRVFFKEYRKKKPSTYGNRELVPYTMRWWLEQCTRCGVHRGARPGKKFYVLTPENAQSTIRDHHENWEREQAIEALAGIGE
jgi:hypothetical protein